MSRAYSLQQTAAAIGLDRTTVYRKVQAGEIPCNKSLGPRAWRIPGEWVERFTVVSTVVTTQPGATESNKTRTPQRRKAS